MLSRHPWLVQAFGSYVLYGPGKARHDDRAFAVFQAAGFRGAEVERAAAALFTFVLGNALGPAAASSLARKLQHDGPEGEERLAVTMAKAREVANQFPHLRARLARSSATGYAAAPSKTFEFGLQAVLDGLEAQVSAHPKGSRSARRRPTAGVEH
jgi:hypothetical protein